MVTTAAGKSRLSFNYRGFFLTSLNYHRKTKKRKKLRISDAAEKLGLGVQIVDEEHGRLNEPGLFEGGRREGLVIDDVLGPVKKVIVANSDEMFDVKS